MSSQEVQHVIIEGFVGYFISKNPCFSFLSPDPKLHVFTKLENRQLDGSDVIELAGQGSLYIREMVWFIPPSQKNSSKCMQWPA